MRWLDKSVQFFVLYFYAMAKILQRGQKPDGIRGSAVFLFVDPPSIRKHGVVAFVLPRNVEVEIFKKDLWGPFGYSTEIDLRGKHLYGRDTWGMVNEAQIAANPPLQRLARRYPGSPILLAGVRKIWGYHPWPLNNPNNFVLVNK